MLEALEALGGLFIVFLAISMIFVSFFVWIGGKILDIKNVTFRRAVLAATVSSLITYLLTASFYIFPILNTIVGFCIGLFLSLFTIKIIFNSTYQKTLITWMFNVFAQILAVIIGTVLFVGGIDDLIKII